MIQEEYFQWIVSQIDNRNYIDVSQYKQLLMCLHSVSFIPVLPLDHNRSAEGVMLRYNFRYESGYGDMYDVVVPENMTHGCTMLELMLSLSISIEDTMSNSAYGNRVALWFAFMLNSMGIARFTDDAFDLACVLAAISRVNSRTYQPDGSGGLFTIPDSPVDLRFEELWFQANRFMEYYLQNNS